METRRVQKVSTQTYIVSLPKRWAIKHRVSAGTTIAMEESASGSLILRPGEGRVALKIPHLTDAETIEESLVAAYLLGAMEITVTASTPAMRARTLAILAELTGLEVATEQGDVLTIRCLIDESSVRLPALLDRMCVLLTYGVTLVTNGDAMQVQQNEREINRTYHLCQRLLTRAAHDAAFLERTGVPSAHAILAYQLLVKRLEHTGDALKELPLKLSPKDRVVVDTLVKDICAMVRSLTAQKTDGKLPLRDRLQKIGREASVAQIAFLARTAQDVREEIVLLRMGAKLL